MDKRKALKLSAAALLSTAALAGCAVVPYEPAPVYAAPAPVYVAPAATVVVRPSYGYYGYYGGYRGSRWRHWR